MWDEKIVELSLGKIFELEDKMSNLTTGKNKHMILDDRTEIQKCLNKGMTFKAIGIRIKKVIVVKKVALSK